MFGAWALAQLAAEMGVIVAYQHAVSRNEARMERDRYESLFLADLLSDDEPATERYQARLRGIEQGWDGYQREAWRRKHGYTAWHMILSIPDPSRCLS